MFEKFKLTESFLDQYRGKQPKWGPLGLITYKRTYARKIEAENRTEEFWETLKRVVEGTFTIQKRHCTTLGLPWKQSEAQKSAQKMFDKMWNFKFLPSGRGLWLQGTDFIDDKCSSAGLQNCAFVSTFDIDIKGTKAFEFTMDMLMLGVGVGFDVEGANKIIIKYPKKYDKGERFNFEIPDSREGWVESLRILLKSFFEGKAYPDFDYSKIRPAGSLIKGFGGTASGYAPLEDMHIKISDILMARVGENIKSTDIVDIMNYIAKCVVAGNVRRSAELAMGRIEDVDFATMKDPITHKAELEDRRWASNNSINAKVGMDYSSLIPSIIKNGEPGILWLENAKNFSRMKNGPDYKDELAVGYNPSLRRGTKVLTTNGIYPIEELQDKDFFIKNLTGEISPAKCFLSGKNKKLFKIVLSGGHEYFCTEEHKWPVLYKNGIYKKKKTTELKEGDYLPILKNNRLFDGVEGTYNEGFMFGYNLGDGWITKRKDNGKTQIGFILNKEDYNSKIKDMLLEQLKLKGCNCNFNKHDKEATEDYEVNTQHTELSNWFKARGFINKSYGIPKFVFEKASEDFRKGLIDGLFSSDGSIAKEGRISFSSSHEKLAKDVSEILGFYGIKTSILKKITKDASFPNGKKYDREYVSYLVRVNDNKSQIHFAKIFKLSNERKQKKLDNINIKGRFIVSPNNIKIISVEETQLEEDVWDVSVFDETHCFQIGHCITGNCGEQTLESYELCNLVETFPSNHDTYEDYEDTLKYAYMYAKTITLLNTHFAETNAVMLKNRRIGLSQSGIIDAFVKHGRRNIINWCEKGYEFLRKKDKQYSDWLCIPQSIKITTVKPSGSISLLPGVSPGIHYPHAEYYIRRIRVSADSYLVEKHKESGYDVEDDIYSPNTKVISFPIMEKNFSKSKKDITIWEQMENAVSYQRHWSDNAVSITVSFKKEEENQIKEVLEHFEDRLKGVSFLPISDHGYKQAPYEEITKEEYDKIVKKIKPLDLSEHNETAKGEKYCTNDNCGF